MITRDLRRSVLFMTYLGTSPQNPPLLAISEPSATTGGATYGFTLEVDRSKINNPKRRPIATTAVMCLVKVGPPIQALSAILYHSVTLKRQLKTRPNHEGFLLKFQRKRHQHCIQMQGVLHSPSQIPPPLLRPRPARAGEVFSGQITQFAKTLLETRPT